MATPVILFWLCIAIVLILSFGNTTYRKLHALHAKHHRIRWDEYNVYVSDDNEKA